MKIRELPETFERMASLLRGAAQSMTQLAVVMDQIRVSVEQLIKTLPEESRDAEV